MKQIAYYEEILSNDELCKKVIKDELVEVKEKYGDARRQLNAGAKELTSNDGTLKASGTQLAQSGTQIATVVNQMSTLFTGLGQQLPEMLQGIDQLKAGSGPVSYTHLDVYKRQVLC